MKKVFSLFAMMLLVAGLASSCDAASKMCGPCGQIENGDATITGMAQLDGIFKALGTLDASAGSIKANFDGNVRDLAAVFGIEAEGMATADIVTEIKAEFAAQITAQGSITVDYVPPSCSADISVSASASAQCEAKAGCDVDVNAECDPGQLSFACEGKCTGGCSGSCSGSCTVEVDAECSGTCKGSCDLSVDPGGCEGTCKGDCEGTCSLTNTAGDCEGECDGTCTGSCKLPEAGGSCSGTCKGECKVEAAAECSGKCEGECDMECTGGCEGSFEPPSCNAEASASCEASADCSAQAEAQASASLKCTPPSLAIVFEGDLDASAQAEVLAKLELFKVKMIGVIQGMFELRGLVEGNADLNIDPPVVTIGIAIEDFAQAVANGEVEIVAVGLLPCAAPAFEEAADIIGGIAGDMEGTISAQLDLVSVLNIM